MADICFISVGTLKESYLKDAVAEYKKRLMQYAKVEEINISEQTIKNEDDISEVRRALDAEGERIIAKIPKASYIIAMCVEGKEYDSIALAKAIGEAVDLRGRVTFIIGSSHGLSDNVKNLADAKISLSRLTFPHQLMRVILIEAIYRSFTIISGKRYHK
jgi:23S rRNA (pseudouridine1915-N3)-methyltransferase